MADWILVVEGYDEASMRSLAGDALSPKRLQEGGAAPGANVALYQLEHVASDEDVRNAIPTPTRRSARRRPCYMRPPEATRKFGEA